MKIIKFNKILSVICFFVLVQSADCFSENFLPESSYDVCFTPVEDCAHKIITTIAQAKKQILVQAYVFTDMEIAKALVKAKKNRVDVRIIFDKNQLKEKIAVIDYFGKNKIEIIIVDNPRAIMHNKVMIIDDFVVITGSYNFTRGARRNAENIIIIKDSEVAKKYVKNWYKCRL